MVLSPLPTRETGPSLRPSSGIIFAASGLLLLTGLALFNTFAARRAEQRHTPRGSFITVGDVRLHYIEQGTGSPVVLLHGNGAVAEDFFVSGLAGRLAVNHRVIALDRPGFGYSQRPGATSWTAQAQADLIRTVLHHIGVRKPILVGHSWGALVALAMAAAYPADTAGLVLLAGYYFPRRRLDAAIVALTATPLAGPLLYHTLWPVAVRLLMPAALHAIFAPSPVPPHFRDQYPLSLALRPSHIRASVLDTAIMARSARGLSASYGTLRMPVTIFAGPNDQVVDTGFQACRLHHAIPGSTLRLLSDAGHMIHYDAPDQIADAVNAITPAATASW